MKVSFPLMHTIFRIILLLQAVWTVEIDCSQYDEKETHLSLHFKDITSIKNIEKMVNLQELYLGHNELKELPKKIGKLEKLEILFLGYNSLTTLPIEITNLHSLVILDLRGNNIAKSGDGTTTVGKVELRQIFGKRAMLDNGMV